MAGTAVATSLGGFQHLKATTHHSGYGSAVAGEVVGTGRMWGRAATRASFRGLLGNECLLRFSFGASYLKYAGSLGYFCGGSVARGVDTTLCSFVRTVWF